MQKITPFLWFDTQAEEAANFYVSIFKNSKLGSVSGPVVTFQIEGQDFMALNGGTHYKITPGISFLVDCKTQEEVDDLWNRLSEGGETSQCGWLTDKFGVTWQIVPSALGEMMSSGDPEKSRRVMQAMLKMTKLDIAALKLAYDQE